MSPTRLAELRATFTGWNGLALDADRIDATFAVVTELLDEVERLNGLLAAPERRFRDFEGDVWRTVSTRADGEPMIVLRSDGRPCTLTEIDEQFGPLTPLPAAGDGA